MGRRKKGMNLTVNFIRLMGLLVLWTSCTLEGIFASDEDPGFESEETASGTRDFEIFSVFFSPFQSLKDNGGIPSVPFPAPGPAPVPTPVSAPAPAPEPAPELGGEIPSKSHPTPSTGPHLPMFRADPSFQKPRFKRNKGNLKYGKTVGYFFVIIASLLQMALLVFLLIKRKQMIGLVNKYDQSPPELEGRWNGSYGSPA